jgi:hypothetical protein
MIALVGMIVLATAGEAANDDTALLDALAAGARRAASSLELDGQRPYDVVVAASTERRWSVVAELGALFREGEDVRRPGVVEVVVGDDARNSSRYLGRSGSPRLRPSFVVEDVPSALARDLWLTTDDSFKEAVQRYDQKVAALASLSTPWPVDRLAGPVVQGSIPSPEWQLDREAWTQAVVEASAVFAETPSLRSGWVELASEAARAVRVDVAGTRIAQPESFVALYAWCDAVRPDGARVFEEWNHVGATPGDLPTPAALSAALQAMAARVDARARAPIVASYAGPVVFEGRAVVQLFAGLLEPQLDGTPPIPRPGASWEQLVRGGPRVGRRVLPEGWSVVDDPTTWPVALPGAYRWDRDGVAAQPVSLVADGRVSDLLRTTAPRPNSAGDMPASNGHARGGIQAAWDARFAHWRVEPARGLSGRGLRVAIERERRAADVDEVLVVRSLQAARPGSLERIADAVWRAPDGTERPVVSLQFLDADRRVLRDLVAASADRQTVGYLAGSSAGAAFGTTDGLPTVASVPVSVLVADLELVFPGSDREPDAYTMPPLGVLSETSR